MRAELLDVGLADFRVFVQALDLRLVPAAGCSKPRPFAPAAPQPSTSAANSSQAGARAFRDRLLGEQGEQPGAAALHVVEHAAGRLRADAGTSCMARKPATRSRGFCAQRSTASTSLTCAASRNLRPPNLTNGMLRRVSSISSARCAARCGTAPPAPSADAGLAPGEHLFDDVARLVGSRRAP
jgi:hypothetical protein